MKKMLLVCFLLFSLSIFSQIHNRMFKINLGLSHEQFDFKNKVKSFNDSSLFNHFDHKFATPVVSISEDFTLNQLFSISGTIGYQMFSTLYNKEYYGTHLFFGSLNPQLTVFYKAGYDIYIKLKLGMVYRVNKLSNLSDQTQRIFPEKFNLFTGVSGGVNLFLNSKWGVNVELSIWSSEFVNFGLTYRFFKGDMPTAEQLEEYYVD